MSTVYLCIGGPLNNTAICCRALRGQFSVDANDESKRKHHYTVNTNTGTAQYSHTTIEGKHK